MVPNMGSVLWNRQMLYVPSLICPLWYGPCNMGFMLWTAYDLSLCLLWYTTCGIVPVIYSHMPSVCATCGMVPVIWALSYPLSDGLCSYTMTGSVYLHSVTPVPVPLTCTQLVSPSPSAHTALPACHPPFFSFPSRSTRLQIIIQ